MNIVIIEDEKLTATDLEQTIKAVVPDCNISAILNSVKVAVDYFNNESMPDLIFSDIQLGDGLSFDIFKTVKITSPVIFCTAYDEYALEAFKTNSIDYILKPFSEDSVLDAINKYRQMKQSFATKEYDYDSVINALLQKKNITTSSILVHYKDKILPVRMNNIALFYIEVEVVSLLTLDGKRYHVSKSLDELNKITGEDFFRTNRQSLVNRNAIKDVSHYFSGKLSVNLNVSYEGKILVSRAKRTTFLEWLEQS